MNKKTIFIVDDDSTNLMAGRNALEEHYNVLTLNSGVRLLKMLEKRTPDLILLDIEMPEMNGYETIKNLKGKRETEHIPIIFLTAKSDSDSELEGLSLGAIDYIAKPFSKPLLLKRIEVHLLVESQKQELIHFNNNLQELVEEKTKSVMELQDALLKTMAELVEYRDDVTGGHIGRTQSYLEILIKKMRTVGLYKDIISSWDTRLVLQSAQLHDVGKIAIKDVVLLKPGKLTFEEFEQIKWHTTFGEKIISRIQECTPNQEFLEYASVMTISHHEKWDGSGYPNGLIGEDIPLLGRLMAIADVYDALISDRPYKPAYTHEEAVKIITDGKGSHFDPKLVDMFLDVAEEFDQIAEQQKG